MITTNHTWSAPAGDGARRWFVLSISEEKVGDSAWFEPIYAGLDRGGYGQFLRVCTEKLNPRVVMVKSGQDGVRTYATGSLNRPRIRRIFV
jgi:hypothetical protein